MKSLEFIYQDVEIHFLLGNDKDVMVNATEMAKAFGKRIDHFLKADHVKEFISVLEFTPFGGNSTPLTKDEIIQTKGQNGTYFHKILALKFAAWLDPIFEVWVYSTIEDILFGNYKRHWDAHIKQEQTKEEMESIKLRLITNPTTEDVVRYFQLEQVYKNCSAEKAKAIKSQYKLDFK
jgi:hypothetical protein